jgi:hypothetical protein
MSDYLLITEEKRRAQKRYRCVHCAERIEPGEEHVYTVGTSEGFIQADRWHSECRRVVNEEFCLQDFLKWEPGAYQRGSSSVYLVPTA